MSEYPSAAERAAAANRPDSAGDRPGGPVSDRLQALLSRAVQDQLSEQREVATLLGEVRGLLGELRGEIRSAGAATGIQAVTAALAHLGEELRADASEQAGAIDDVRGELAGLLQELRGLAGRTAEPGSLGGVTERIEQIHRTLDTLATAADVRSVAERVVGLADRVEALDERMYTVADRLSGVESLPAEVAAIRARIDGAAQGAGYGGLDADALAALRAEVGELARRMATVLPGVYDERLGETVRAMVDQPIAAAEDRLRAHVDDAVLVLAEALLRRPGPARAPVVDEASTDGVVSADRTPATAPTPVAGTAADALAELRLADEEADEGADEGTDDGTDEEPDAEFGYRAESPPLQPASTAAPLAWRSWTYSGASDVDRDEPRDDDSDRRTAADIAEPNEEFPAERAVDDDDEDEPRRRRGWWGH